jgi:prolyl-tRNA editing enzyme YbaK/EbsC (Cys-tRNA(Pro) deacylase)
MHPYAEHVQSVIKSSGEPCQVRELPNSTRSAPEAAAAIGTTIAQIVKSLVFLAEAEPLLVLASGINRVSVAKLEALVGRPVSRADANKVKSLTGFPIGGVSPVGLKCSARVLIDEDLRLHAELWAAAGTPHAVFPCSPDQLARMSKGKFADVKETAP